MPFSRPASTPGSRLRSFSPYPQSTSGASRHSMNSSVPTIPQAENLILSDGPVGEEAVELLTELVHHSPELPLAEAEEELDHSKPWWRTASPLWLLLFMPFSAIAMSSTLAPRIEIYTMLACSVHKPEIFWQFPSDPTFLHSALSSPLSPSSADMAHVINLPLLQSNISTPTPTDPLLVYTGATVLRNGTRANPDRQALCTKDPVVQAAVAQLTAILSATMGILSCLTTAWWGSFSDRHGRTKVMGISILGLLLTDVNFIFVTFCSHKIPGGYWFLLLGPVVEGSLGGMTSAIAAMHAYLADTTTSANRSRIFSLSLGLLFTGVALGPTIGGLLIRVTHQTLSVFYLATAIHLTYAILVWTFIPESLSQGKMLEFREKYLKDKEHALRGREVAAYTLARRTIVKAKHAFRFLSPLHVLFPNSLEMENVNPLKQPKRDWSLILTAASYGFTISIMGSYPYKFQYAASTFGWTSETLGYWLSLVGAARAFYLTLILPIAIRLFKPKPKYMQRSIEGPVETEPLLPPRSSSSPLAKSQDQPPSREIHSPTFDLGIARVSLFIEIVAYTLMAFAPTPLAFTAFGMLGSMGAGFSPATQSVALELYIRRGGKESGKLFGALSVIQALCSQILGPAVFGYTYMKTVASFPRAIFFLSVGAVLVSFVLLSFVRIPRSPRVGDEEAELPSTHDREASVVEAEYRN